MERSAKFSSQQLDPDTRHDYVLTRVVDDEVDLADLIRNIASEWKKIGLIMAIGVLLSGVLAYSLSRVYIVEAILRAPTIHEMGEVASQSLIEIDPEGALRRVADQLATPEVHKITLEKSGLLDELSDSGRFSGSQVVRNIYDNFSLEVLKHAYYELDAGEKTPLKNIKLSIQSEEPEKAMLYLRELIDNSHERVRTVFMKDLAVVRQARIKAIQDQIEALTQAERSNREARIARLLDANREKIVKLEQKIDLKLREARQNRQNRIRQLEEALKIATELGIRDPVSWEDLRPTQAASQILDNRKGSRDEPAPLYFNGVRLLQVDLDLLKARQDERPFVTDLVELENQLSEIRNDPVIAALEVRSNDAIYIENHDGLQRELSKLRAQAIELENARFAVVSQPETMSTGPKSNPLFIFSLGVLFTGFIALGAAIISSSLRRDAAQRAQVSLIN